MAEKTADYAAEIAQVAPNEFVHEIGFRSFDRPAHLKVDGGVTGRFLERLKILPDWGEELATHLVIQRQLRIETQFSAETDRARRRKANVGRAQKQLVDCHDAGA